MQRSIHGNTEIYTLGNNINILFDILGNKLTVIAQKTDERILNMNCEYVDGFSDADELQADQINCMKVLEIWDFGLALASRQPAPV